MPWYRFPASSANTKITAEGGYAVRMINKTGAASVKGDVVMGNSALTDSFALSAINSANPIGIVAESGVADGSYCWVTISGKALVNIVNEATDDGYIRVCVTADPGAAAGKGIWENIPTTPFATDKHFQECSHNLALGTGQILCNIHFN